MADAAAADAAAAPRAQGWDNEAFLLRAWRRRVAADDIAVAYMEPDFMLTAARDASPALSSRPPIVSAATERAYCC
jgi:hypothetical protein